MQNFAGSGGSGETSTPSQRQPIPGLEFIGMGYDVFDRYASVDSCKQHILDFSAEPEVDQQVIDASVQVEALKVAFIGPHGNQVDLQATKKRLVSSTLRGEVRLRIRFDYR